MSPPRCRGPGSAIGSGVLDDAEGIVVSDRVDAGSTGVAVEAGLLLHPPIASASAVDNAAVAKRAARRGRAERRTNTPSEYRKITTADVYSVASRRRTICAQVRIAALSRDDRNQYQCDRNEFGTHGYCGSSANSA